MCISKLRRHFVKSVLVPFNHLNFGIPLQTARVFRLRGFALDIEKQFLIYCTNVWCLVYYNSRVVCITGTILQNTRLFCAIFLHAYFRFRFLNALMLSSDREDGWSMKILALFPDCKISVDPA